MNIFIPLEFSNQQLCFPHNPTKINKKYSSALYGKRESGIRNNYGSSVILAPKFFLKPAENNSPINKYHAPGGFGKASAPAPLW